MCHALVDVNAALDTNGWQFQFGQTPGIMWSPAGQIFAVMAWIGEQARSTINGPDRPAYDRWHNGGFWSSGNGIPHGGGGWQLPRLVAS